MQSHYIISFSIFPSFIHLFFFIKSSKDISPYIIAKDKNCLSISDTFSFSNYFRFRIEFEKKSKKARFIYQPDNRVRGKKTTINTAQPLIIEIVFFRLRTNPGAERCELHNFSTEKILQLQRGAQRAHICLDWHRFDKSLNVHIYNPCWKWIFPRPYFPPCFRPRINR